MPSAIAEKLEVYKSLLKLSTKQKELLVGALLGDGNLRFVGRNHEASFVVDHSSVQKEYVFSKYKIMKEWVTTEPKQLTRIYHKDRNRQLTSFRFQTISHPELTTWYHIFYLNGKKIIPGNIKELLVSPFSLAIWFMDDGNKNHRAVFFNTQQFSREEQELLRACLKVNFGLETALNKHWVFNGKQLYRIRVNTKSTKRLYALIRDFVIPSMTYKLPLYPRNDFSDANRKDGML
jgi:hypothetical protein